jgi:hypothetical protein
MISLCDSAFNPRRLRQAGHPTMLFRIVQFSPDELAITGDLPREVVRQIVEIRGARVLHWKGSAVTLIFPERRERDVRNILQDSDLPR